MASATTTATNGVAPPAAPAATNGATGAGGGAGAKSLAEMTSKDYYFDSYSHFSIHEEMLKDEVRTKTYRNAIVNNKHKFKGKIVLDVGCGTGILSMFAAQAGAKHVYGIDCSSIIEQATEIVKINGFADKITLIKGKVEEVDLPVDKVDIIISEWMGYFLLYESMLDTVLVARDKWLKPDGMLFPDVARILVTTIEDAEYKEEKISFWDNVYGFNMAPIKKLAMVEPLVDVVDSQTILSGADKLVEFDCYKVTKEELAFKKPFTVSFTRQDFCHALVAYFEVDFGASHKKLVLSTGPEDDYTHWKQTVFYLTEPLAVNEGDTLQGMLSCKPNEKNPRDLDIDIDYTFTSAEEGETKWTQSYRLR